MSGKIKLKLLLKNHIIIADLLQIKFETGIFDKLLLLVIC